MTQNARVISLDGDKATVSVIRRSACEGCKQKSLCAGVSGDCAEQKELLATVKNKIGAKVGDEVELSTPTWIVLGSAFCVFVLPIVLAFALFSVLSATAFAQAYIYGITLGVFILSCVVICFVLDRFMKKDTRVEIVKILKEEN